MTAELNVMATALPLLLEPDRPRKSKGHRVYQGWRRVMVREQGVLVAKAARDHSADDWGATVQWMIVRYVLRGESRADLAAEHAMTPDTCQKYLTGVTFKSYTQPVLRALKRLGIGTRHGTRHERLAEIVRAQAAVMQRFVLSPTDRAVLTDMRLLSAAWEAVS